MKFRSVPKVVDAIRCVDAIHAFSKDWKALPDWLEAAYEKGGVVATPEGVYLPTPEGSMLARREDWIICGTKGELYPCKPDIFEERYEPYGA